MRNYPHLKKAFIAYDRDVMVKKEVYASLCRLGRSLEHAGFNVLVRTWPDLYKGFDDYLCAAAAGSRNMEVAV